LAPDDRRVRLDNLGAWLIKGNADRADLAERFAHDPRVARWCVQPSYRVDLMRAGQPVLFWASGSRDRRLRYGIWGVGRLAGPPRPDDWSVPLDLVVAEPEQRLPRETLRADPRLVDLEVLRQPQAANPSYVTPRQLAAITEHWARCRAVPPPATGGDGPASAAGAG
jgi:hypothetical protein